MYCPSGATAPVGRMPSPEGKLYSAALQRSVGNSRHSSTILLPWVCKKAVSFRLPQFVRTVQKRGPV